MDEIMNGTNVCDESGQMHGLSSKAGIICVGQTAITRCVLVPCSCLLIPPVVMSQLGRMKLLPQSSRSRLLVELSVIYLSLQLALPAALAVFPQVMSNDHKLLLRVYFRISKKCISFYKQYFLLIHNLYLTFIPLHVLCLNARRLLSPCRA
jgi:hypothetical protein